MEKGNNACKCNSKWLYIFCFQAVLHLSLWSSLTWWGDCIVDITIASANVRVICANITLYHFFIFSVKMFFSPLSLYILYTEIFWCLLHLKKTFQANKPCISCTVKCASKKLSKQRFYLLTTVVREFYIPSLALHIRLVNILEECNCWQENLHSTWCRPSAIFIISVSRLLCPHQVVWKL